MDNRESRIELIECIKELEDTGILEVGGGAVGLRQPDGTALVTPTGLPYRRWAFPIEDLLNLDLDGNVIERGDRLAAAPTPMFLRILREFSEVNAVIHGHCQWSLAFAAAAMDVPAVTNAYDKLAPVPCIICDDQELKARYLADPWPVFIPDGYVDRPDVAAVEEFVVQRAIDIFRPRREELAAHSLAFTMYRHGIVVAGPSLERAAADLAVIESNARTALYLRAGRFDTVEPVAPTADVVAEPLVVR